MADDPDRGTLDRLLTSWQRVFGKTPAMVRDAVNQASVFTEDHQNLVDVLREIACDRGEINRRKLGWWIRRNSGRIVNGRRFVRASGQRSAEAWQIAVTESVSPVLSVSNPENKKSVSADVEDVKDAKTSS
jgi:hypothetical protein